jgi:hypothetical protein
MQRLWTLLLGLVAFGSALPLQAQPILGIGGQAGIPVNEYGENISTLGGGVDLHFSVPVNDGWPLGFGLDLGYMNIGNKSQRLEEVVTISNPGLGTSLTVPLNYRIVTNSNFFHMHALGRLRPPVDWGVVPFADGIVGFRYLWTRTRVIQIQEEDQNYPDTEVDEDVETVVNADTHINDWVFSYGFGGGLHFPFSDKAMLELRVLWARGSEAQYFDREDVQDWEASFEPDTETIDEENPSGKLSLEASPRRSTTDLFFVTLGFAFDLR